MTILEIVQAALSEMGLSTTASAVSTSDLNVTQLLAMANALGNELISDFEWQQLSTIYSFSLQSSVQTGTTTSGSAVVTGLTDTSVLAANTWGVTGNGIVTNAEIYSVDSSTQITMTIAASSSGTASLTFTKLKYAIPADWCKFINRTHWDRTNHWEMIGPKSAQEWEWLKGGIVTAGPRVRYRVVGGYWQIWPLQNNTATVAYEYQSKYWVSTAAGVAPTKSSFTLDTDVCVFRDRLMIAGIKRKYFETKGFDASNFQREYENELSKAMAQDHGAPTLSLAPPYNTILISPANVPDGNVYGR